MAINRYKGQPLPIIIQYDSDPLVPYGKKMTDIVDVSMNLKKKLATDLDNAYLEKKKSISSGVSIDTSRYTFQMNIGESDYTNLLIGQEYYLVIAVEVSGFTNLIELPIAPESRRLVITSDENRF